MSKEILMVAEAVSNERGVDKEVIFEAIEAALASATIRRHGDDIDARVEIDRHSGDYKTFRRWLVVDPAELEEREPTNAELTIEAAHERDPALQVGDFVEVPMESVEFGRIGAQAAKQVIVQKVREAERARVVEMYTDRVGDLISGTVKRVDRGNVILDLGDSAEAFISREELIPRESVRVGDRMRGYLREVRPEPRGPQLFVSRTAPELLIELFTLEVPEISEGLIDVMGAARDPGVRAKIAVRAKTVSRIDPIGACVGMRGSRVQSVSNELGGERVDIILWHENPAQFVINAMQPAEVLSIVVDEDRHSMDVAVAEENLSLAIGRGGQNVRLASQLTGWQLNVMDESAFAEKTEQESRELMQAFMTQLDVGEDVATVLVQEGFSSVDEIAYVADAELTAIEEFDEQLVEELRNRARDVLLTRAIAREERIGDAQPADDLLHMEGMDEELAFELAARGTITMEDLAELSVDELMEIDGMDEERAGQLIMKAREPWFADLENGDEAAQPGSGA
ncbi:MAG: transcription termination/antitermination protein NusA [Chromatiales bacterium]|nr:transcription termination/antitermination protein NusA [Chromatiales bacterium]